MDVVELIPTHFAMVTLLLAVEMQWDQAAADL
jgi:hypothetical protein